MPCSLTQKCVSRLIPPLSACLLLWVGWLAPDASAEESVEPVAHWRFGAEEVSPLVAHGGVQRDQAGPRPPEFPDFEPNNTAVRLDGRGARFVIADPGPESDFDFTNGDTITIEAWVNIDDSIGHDRNLYVIGKGRTGDRRFAADNQNWALRLRGIDGQARLSFLFATEKPKSGGKAGSHWHRWTSDRGFYPGTGWHRIAVSYRFGEPASIRGWLNESTVEGKWDMGGATKEPPVVDDDAVWIGSTMGGSAGNSLKGLVDHISLLRSLPSESEMAARYRRQGEPREIDSVPEVVPQFALAPTAVTVRVFEGIAAHDRWLPATDSSASPVITYQVEDFLFHRLPRRYDDWGIRDSWRPTVLLQAAAEVELPPGDHRLLVRTRGLSRVWLDDEVVARIGARRGGGGGHNPVVPAPEPPAPGHRPTGHGDQQKIVDISVAEAGVYRVTLESLIGTSRLRTEPGEMMLAIQLAGDQAFGLLRPAGAASPSVLVTDGEIEAALARQEQRLVAIDDQVRRRAAAAHDDHWAGRHEAARRWVEQNPPPAVPDVVVPDFADGSQIHPIDAFLAAKIAQAKSEVAAESHGDVGQFQDQVLPILRQHCFRCHDDSGDGGLDLTSRATLLVGGDSGNPAVVPGHPERSQLISRIRATDEGEQMPPSGSLTADEIDLLEQWVASGVSWGRELNDEAVTPSRPVDDAAFIRRAYLDTWGVPPSEAKSTAFLRDTAADKRVRLIDRLLDDPRLADHWVSYWQDVLAENPSMLKPSINNTGPFRFFIHEALRDGKPWDRLVTELVMLRGSEREGGSAGFGMAADNDAPLATRGLVLASAFLGIDLQCARCHDSPYHSTTQQDLFSLSAMLARKPVTVPSTSSVSPGFFEQHKGRESLIRVTLKPGVPVAPDWPFATATGANDDESVDSLMRRPEDTRERLATLITAPTNQRFAAVIVNRVWKRLLGAGLVEPADDWDAERASHPELLQWLARDWVAAGYSPRHLIRQIMTSDVYQREAVGANQVATAADRFFAAPDRRRLTAEQIVDSLFQASGHPLRVDELTFDGDGHQAAASMITLGRPQRAWEFATLSNERDRPSLALPRAQAVTDVLQAFGWNGSRQNALTDRATAPNVLQPGILANGVMSTWVTRASIDSELANLAVTAATPERLVDSLFFRFLTRPPTAAESSQFVATIAEGFDERVLPSEQVVTPEPLPPLSYVSWTNHLRPEANVIKVEMERRAREGDPADPRLRPAWREAYEDIVWSLVNSPEFVIVP